MHLSSQAISLQGIVQDLKGHEQLIRLKKLLYYTCQNIWENNVKVLNQLDLEKLLKNLLESNQTLEDLSDSLYQSIETLNRQDIYSELANLVIAKLGKFYEDSNDATGVILVKPQIRDNIPNILVDTIIANFKKHPELARIKKLIYYISQEQWENDLNIINSYDFKDLIISLREIYSSKEELDSGLDDIVSTLNRQHLYLEIAATISQEMARLYGENDQETQLFSKTPIVTQIIEPKTAPAPVAISKETYVVIANNSPEELLDNSGEEPQKKSSKNQKYDCFDWRLDIMQYTNPLRVKIMLFSILYHKFNNDEKDWSMLRTCTLDDLVSKILSRFASLAEIESKMASLSNSSPKSENNQQTAHVIIKSLAPFYEEN